MGKDKRKSVPDKGGASPIDEEPTLDVPPVKIERDKLNLGSMPHTYTEENSDKIDRYLEDSSKLARTIYDKKFNYQKTGKSISEDDAKGVAEKTKNLHMNPSFDMCAHYMALLAGKCLELKEGESVGDVYTVSH